MIWIYNISWLHVDGIVLWPFVLIRTPKAGTSQRLIRHEKVHVRQCYRLLIVGFYIAYVFQYFKLRLRGFSHFDAYQNNPFEIEAQEAEHATS